MFDGAVEIRNVVKEEVEKAAAEDTPQAGAKRRAQSPALQRVRIDPTPSTPFENALAWIEAAIAPLATASTVLVLGQSPVAANTAPCWRCGWPA
ncbi:MAG: hypothetical protein Q7T97_04185 [Burkholderiaceae bacterium]|nr:hypothetical protein [Burkholderiaceae bacterium]